MSIGAVASTRDIGRTHADDHRVDHGVDIWAEVIRPSDVPRRGNAVSLPAAEGCVIRAAPLPASRHLLG